MFSQWSSYLLIDFIRLSPKFDGNGAIDSKLALIQVMARCEVRDSTNVD